MPGARASGSFHMDRIERIGRCFFPPDRRLRADVAIVFGMSAPERPVERAVELFNAGIVRRLLFTGGYNERLGRAEADEMAVLANGQGVPAEAILIEDRARNTEENIELSCRLLEDRWGAAGVGSVMLLTIHYHLRRAHLAARRRIPEDVALGWTCYPSLHYTSRNWFEVERGRRDVTSEIEKIERYYGLKLADLPELDG
ncbi:MAG: YdcF family protein [Flavobacteriaceae bacterium]